MLWLRDQMALKTLPLKLSCQGLTWKNFWSHVFLLSDTGHHNILLHIPIKRFEVNFSLICDNCTSHIVPSCLFSLYILAYLETRGQTFFLFFFNCAFLPECQISHWDILPFYSRLSSEAAGTASNYSTPTPHSPVPAWLNWKWLSSSNNFHTYIFWWFPHKESFAK